MVDDMTRTLMKSNEEKKSTCKESKSFRCKIGKKKDKVANKTSTLIEKKTV